MKKILKKENIKYILLFFLFLVWQLFYNNLFCDYLWSYGFSYNIATGLVPYQDFNMIVPPLTSILFSIPLIFAKGIHIFALSYSLLLVFMSYFMFKLFGQKTYLFLLLFFIPSPLFIFLCNYNLLLYLFFLVLVYLEKKDNFDYTIGVVAALSFFTKQSIGALFVLVSLYLVRDEKDKFRKRLIGIVTIFLLFLFYFLVNHNLYSFIDQCFLGMFSFSSKNGKLNFYIPLFLGLIIYTIKKIIKNKNEKTNYYVFCFLFFSYPTFDSAHFVLSLAAFLTLFVDHKKQTKILQYIFIFPILFITTILFLSDFKENYIYPNQISNFEYYYLPENVVRNIERVSQYVQKNRDKKIVFITSTSYVYKISNHLSVERYLDLLNYGNMGLGGSRNAIKEIKDYPYDTIFLVDDLLLKQNLKRKTQLDQKVLEYFYKNTKMVGILENFTIYQKK